MAIRDSLKAPGGELSRRIGIRVGDESGIAMLIAVIALSIFSLIGIFLSLNATTEVRISDNHEAQIQATVAAQAGLNHARESMRGIEHNDLLQGPDGVGDSSTAPTTLAEEYAFRNWVDWTTARALNLIDPTSSVASLPDDGLVNTGKYGSTSGTPIIPATGIALTAPNPYGSGSITTARYFVKVVDNPDVEDGDGDPFVDNDGIVVVRSIGVAHTIEENGGGVVRANSVAVYEARFKKSTAFDLEAPVILQGKNLVPAQPNMFNGNSFDIDGNNYPYGIGTIDMTPDDGVNSADTVKAYLDPKTQYDNITGSSGAEPAIGDVTPTPGSDNYELMDPAYVYGFMYDVLPKYADKYYVGNQKWSGGGAPDLGYYDPSLDRSDPSQRYQITYVDGDVSLSGNVKGGGILAVTGRMSGSGSLVWNGLVLVIGTGIADFSGMNVHIYGGLYVVNVQPDADGNPQFGTTQFTISGNSNIVADDEVIKLSVDTLPAKELSWREVSSEMDP